MIELKLRGACVVAVGKSVRLIFRLLLVVALRYEVVVVEVLNKKVGRIGG